MSNKIFFQEKHKPHTGYYVAGFDSAVNSGDCSIGVFVGQYRAIPAIIAPGASEQDQWKVVNLKKGENHFDSVAVLGVVDDQDALDMAHMHYGRMFDSVGDGVVTSNMIGLKRHLDTKLYQDKPIQQWQLDQYQNVLTNEVPMWDSASSNLLSHDGSFDLLMLDLRRCDFGNELLHSFDSSLGELLASEDQQIDDFDSIVTRYQYLEKTANILHSEMKKAAKVGKVKVASVEISKPFKRNGVVQIGISYHFDDGQKAIVLFHNPDSTPAKLQQDDIMVSWKIQLNSRDVTGLIQPSQTEGLAPTSFALRMMQLANKNSASFKRAQAKKAENAQKLQDSQDRLAAKQDSLKSLDQEIEALQGQLDSLQKAPLNLEDPLDGDETKESEDKPYVDYAENQEETEKLTLEDINYLNNVISGAIEPLSVDMDRMISIGEKDETHELFVGALSIIEKAVDEFSA